MDVKVWRDGVCERTIRRTRHGWAWRCRAERASSAVRTTAQRAVDARRRLERTFEISNDLGRIAALPDGVHFAVGLTRGEVKLYHVDGTLVHTFEGHTAR